jgi:hypothetical protein
MKSNIGASGMLLMKVPGGAMPSLKGMASLKQQHLGWIIILLFNDNSALAKNIVT